MKDSAAKQTVNRFLDNVKKLWEKVNWQALFSLIPLAAVAVAYWQMLAGQEL